MCIAIPYEVVSVDGLLAEIVANGSQREVSLSLISEPVAVGDWVTLQAGRYVVGRMDADEARTRLDLFAELLGPDLVSKETVA